MLTKLDGEWIKEFATTRQIGPAKSARRFSADPRTDALLGLLLRKLNIQTQGAVAQVLEEV